MMVDMKYHIASMVAVFLALGVGILVGSAMVGDSVLIEQQERLIDRLELDFAELRASREDLRARLSASDRLLEASFRFEEEACARLASGRLAGTRVAVIVSADGVSGATLDRVCRAIEGAGGVVTVVAHVWKRLEPVSAEEARTLATACGIAATSPQAIGRAAARALANGVVLGEAGPSLLALGTLGYVTLDRDAPEPADAVVLAGGSHDPASSATHVDVPVLRAIGQAGLPAVGIEPSDVRFSYIEHYKREGIATVDCVDTPVGRLSLVYALAGEEGHFGVKESAERLAPDVFSE